MLAMRSRGFTLLELMVTLTVAGVLLSVGVPSFFDVIRNSRAAANANELVTALSIARSEAIRRGARVSICRSANGAACGGTWQQGWIVFLDTAATDIAAPTVGDVLRVWPAPSGNTTIATAPANMEWVRFLPRGNVRTAGAMPVVYTMTVQGCSGLQARSIELNNIGRTSVARVGCP
jgi:type IV fimbrial biogenesis protein FimT